MESKKIKLDIGCGRNKREGFTGVDIDEKSDADIIASALNLPFEEGNVEEINCSHLVEHFSPEEAQKVFDEIYRVLRKDGLAHLKIDRDWSEKRLLEKDPTHKRRYSVEEIKKMTKKFSSRKVKRKIYRNRWHIRNKIFVELKK